MSSLRRHALPCGLLLTLLGCTGHTPATDASLPDSSVPDAALDADVTPDAGPPPACAIVPSVVAALPGYGAGSTAPPTGFAATGGHYAYTFASPPAVGDGSAVHLAVVDSDGATLADEALEEALTTDARLSDSTLAALGGSFFAVWTRANLDASGAVSGADIHNAMLASDGELLRPAASLYDSAVAPLLVGGDAGGFLLRSELALVSGTAVITPRLVRLDIGGDPVGIDVTLLAFWQAAATELMLAPADIGPTLLSRVPPSQLFSVTFSPEGGPLRTERRVTGFAYLDAVAAQGDRVLAVSTELSGGEGHVDAFVLSRDGSLVAQLELGRGGDVQPRAAAFAAWPGFVVAWREGAGDAASIHAAGFDEEGRLLVPSQSIVAVPGAEGPLFGASDGDGFALGFRQETADGSASLGLVRSCVPR